MNQVGVISRHIFRGRTNKVVVNGEEVDLDEWRRFKQQQRAPSDKKQDAEYSTRWHIATTTAPQVGRVTVRDEGSLVLDDNLLTRRPKLDVSGSCKPFPCPSSWHVQMP